MNSTSILTEIPSCESTQDEVRALLNRDSHLDFIAVRAERQTRGRGRQDREWISPEGNLFLSLGFRIEASLSRPWPFVSLIAGLAAARCLARVGCWDKSCFVKWPNDLYLVRAGKSAKLGGILTELSRNLLFVGVGINITATPQLSGATYSSACLGDIHPKPPTASELAHALTIELKTLIEEWISTPERTSHAVIEELSSSWMRPFFSMTGEVEAFGSARAMRLLSDGRLMVESLAQPGLERPVSSGEFLLL